MGLLKSLFGGSDGKLATKREKVRKAYCSSGGNFKKACKLQKKLERIDRKMSKRAWGKKKPSGPSIHREHGWYLPNDD